MNTGNVAKPLLMVEGACAAVISAYAITGSVPVTVTVAVVATVLGSAGPRRVAAEPGPSDAR